MRQAPTAGWRKQRTVRRPLHLSQADMACRASRKPRAGYIPNRALASPSATLGCCLNELPADQGQAPSVARLERVYERRSCQVTTWVMALERIIGRSGPTSRRVKGGGLANDHSLNESYEGSARKAQNNNHLPSDKRALQSHYSAAPAGAHCPQQRPPQPICCDAPDSLTAHRLEGPAPFAPSVGSESTPTGPASLTALRPLSDDEEPDKGAPVFAPTIVSLITRPPLHPPGEGCPEGIGTSPRNEGPRIVKC